MIATLLTRGELTDTTTYLGVGKSRSGVGDGGSGVRDGGSSNLEECMVMKVLVLKVNKCRV